MRIPSYMAALVGLTAAMPHEPITENGMSLVDGFSPLEKRVPDYCKYTSFWLCYKLSKSYGPVPTPDDAATFLSYPAFSQAANSAMTPSKYLKTFQNFNSTTSTSQYLGWRELQTYDPAACAAKCDSVRRCVGFNIYFERDPTTTTDATCCPNPKSLTRIKCTMWGVPTTSTTANNFGIKRDSFQVVMAGSNGYNKQIVLTSSSSTAKSSTSSGKASTAGTSTGSKATSAGASSAGTSKGSSATSAAGSPTASTKGPNVAVTNSPSMTPSPTPSSSSTSLSGLAVSSQSALVASSAAAETVTDPGSPVTASVPSVASSAATGCATPVSAPEVTFNLNRTTYGTETIYIYGSIDVLGQWNVDDAVLLSSYDITPTKTNWFVGFNLTEGTYFEYKYFQRNSDWSITWPPLDNRQYTVPSSCLTDIVVNDKWDAK